MGMIDFSGRTDPEGNDEELGFFFPTRKMRARIRERRKKRKARRAARRAKRKASGKRRFIFPGLPPIPLRRRRR